MSISYPMLDTTRMTAQTFTFAGASVTTTYQSVGVLLFPASALDIFNGSNVPVAISFDGVHNHLVLPVGGVGPSFLMGGVWPQGNVFIKSLTVAGASGTVFFNFFGKE